MIQIHMLKLVSHLQANSFEEFARTRYLPALQASASDGQLLSVRLLRQQRTREGEPMDLDTQFLLVSDWSDVPEELPEIGDVVVQRLFEVYGVRVTRIGSFETVSTMSGSAG